VEALSDRLSTLLNDPNRRRQFGRAAREKMERDFELHDQVQTLERYYDDILTHGQVQNHE